MATQFRLTGTQHLSDLLLSRPKKKKSPPRRGKGAAIGAAAGVAGGQRRTVTPQPAPAATPVGPIQPVVDPNLNLIAQYNQARAKILQGMAPQVSDIYQGAAKNLQGIVGGLSQDMQQRLFAGAQEASKDLGVQLEGLAPGLGTDVTSAYSPEASAKAAFALGAAFPGESLAKQGAAFGSAAAFAPERALTEGQYALLAAQKELEKQKATQGMTPYQSAQLARQLANDKFTHDIALKKLKAGQFLTPYEQAALGLRAQSLAASQANADRNFQFKTAKAQADYDAAVAKGAKPNAALSAKYGYIVDSNGHAILGPKGRHIPVAKKPAKPTKATATNLSKAWVLSRRISKGFYATQSDPWTPLSNAQINAYAKAAGLTPNRFLYGTDKKAVDARANANVGAHVIGQHDDRAIQDLYLTLVRQYQIPAWQAFNMVAKYYPQWGKAKRAAYFPGK